MTVSYLDSKRINGLSTDIADIPILDDNLSTQHAGWTADSSDITYDSGNGRINYSADGTTGYQYKALDLQHADFLNGSNLSDSKFICRFKLVITSTSIGSNSEYNEALFGLSSLANAPNLAKDFLGFYVKNFGNNERQYKAQSVNDGSIMGGGQAFSTVVSTGTYYIEIIRTSTTQCTVEIFNADTYATGASVEKETVTISSSIQSLRFFYVGIGRESTETGSNQGYIDNIKIYNGVSSLSSKPNSSTVQTDSLFTETNTGVTTWSSNNWTSPSGGWVELGRHLLGSPAAEVFVSSLPNKRYYMVLYEDKGQASAQARFLRYNNDNSNVYSSRASYNGGSDIMTNTQPQHNGWAANNTLPQFNVFYIANKSDREKLLITHSVYQHTAGVGFAAQRVEYVGKWSNITDAINRIGVIQNAGTHATGTSIVVLGWDPAASHTTNFWEELASVNLSNGTASSISSGTIPAKKYLWYQLYTQQSIDSDYRVTFNSDVGLRYNRRYSYNGGSEQTNLNLNDYPHTSLTAGTPTFTNTFIINNATNEKLMIVHDVMRNTAGAGVPPTRLEGVGKWCNTSNQITNITVTSGSGVLSTKTILKVWGSN